MKNHGTPTQLGTVISAFTTALCAAVMDFPIADVLKAIDKKGEKITKHLRLVLNAIMTGQDLALITKDSKPVLLEPVSSSNVPAIKEFVAKEHFKLGESAGVKISYLGDNFNDHFLKKREENITEVMLKSFKLTQASLSPPIITALGDNHETYLAQLWELLKLQPQGETGILLTNGYVNIFYIRDADGILWAVYVNWFGGGWHVRADSVEDPYWWRAGSQVFGR